MNPVEYLIQQCHNKANKIRKSIIKKWIQRKLTPERKLYNTPSNIDKRQGNNRDYMDCRCYKHRMRLYSLTIWFELETSRYGC